MAKTSASFTIMDYTDGISLITGMDSNLPLTCSYDTDSETLYPSWTSQNPLVLTPKAYIAGQTNPTSIIGSLVSGSDKWYYRTPSDNDWVQITSGTSNYSINSTTKALSVTANKLVNNNWQIMFRFTANYLDSTLQLVFPIEITITFARINNGTSFVVAHAYTPNGDTFKNGTSVSTITIKAELIRGTTHDTSDVTYLWQKLNTSTGNYDDLTSAYSGYNTDTLTPTAAQVDSLAIYRCKITDTALSPAVVYYSEGISIYDVTDPYQAIIESTTGSYFKGDTQTTILICRVFHNGAEIDDTGGNLTYTWTATDKDGNAISAFNTSPPYTAVTWRGKSIASSTHKAVNIANNLVDVKATFYCEVS